MWGKHIQHDGSKVTPESDLGSFVSSNEMQQNFNSPELYIFSLSSKHAMLII
jgi:hypothetical protein